MGRQKYKTFDDTITKYVRNQFIKQATYTGLLLFAVSIVVFAASVKFSTDRYVRGLCADVGQSARILVETSQMKSYEGYFSDIVHRLQDQLKIDDLSVVPDTPEESWRHYSLGGCTLHWRSIFSAQYYIPTHWADKTMYVRGSITPKLIRSDLIMFMIAVCLALVLSYYFGTRRLLIQIKKNISDPIHEIWDSLQTNQPPKDLRFKEMRGLWESLVEYKELVAMRYRMLISKEYNHELKSPAFYLYNQMRLIDQVQEPKKKDQLIRESLQEATELLERMEKALKKIANDDFSRYPKKMNLAELVAKKDRRFKPKQPAWIQGDKTLIQTLLNNLYRNAIEACGSPQEVKSSLHHNGESITLLVENPVPPDIEIDTRKIFKNGFTTKTNGTGMGLALCEHIMIIHSGHIEAVHSREEKTFKIIASFPKLKDDLCSQSTESCITQMA